MNIIIKRLGVSSINRNRKSRDEKVRQRHSVEISSSFLLAQYSSDLAVALEESCVPEKVESSGALSHNGSSLTPTLSLLADLWQKLSEHCIELIQTEPSHVPLIEDSVKSKAAAKENKENKDNNKESKESRDKERKRKPRKENSRPESNCELCGGLFPVPVTQHMRQAHPGCQKPALGLGYNPEGHYCGGWVGNCGEGGIPVRPLKQYLFIHLFIY